jgi:hypothetical protein
MLEDIIEPSVLNKDKNVYSYSFLIQPISFFSQDFRETTTNESGVDRSTLNDFERAERWCVDYRR